MPPQCQFSIELQVSAKQHCFMHTHGCTELIWYRNCSGWMLQSDKRLRYSNGDVGVYQPGLVHGDDCEAGGFHLCVGVSGCGAEQLQPGICHADEASVIAFERIRTEINRHDEGKQQRLNFLAGGLILELHRQLKMKTSNGPQLPWSVEAARQIFDTRFAEPLSMVKISEELSINPDYLRQLFIKWLNEPPLRYLIRKRLECACDLLRLNQKPTGWIAARVGIDNPYYFSRLFRQRFGMTPSQYRAQYAKG